MRITELYDSWCDEFSLLVELIECQGQSPEVCVTCTWTGRGNFDGDGIGWLTLEQLLAAEVNEAFPVDVKTKNGYVGEVTLPYRVIDKALALLGYEEV